MVEKQVTTMVIKVDLGCEKCHKKIKKVMCEIPEIQNQLYDRKANTVTVTVVCCNPEKIKKKICCKGGEVVKGVEIKVPEKTKTKGQSEKTKVAEPPTPPPTKTTYPLPKPYPIPVPVPVCVPAPPAPRPVPGRPLLPVYPITCCSECYQGFSGGPCFHGYGRPTPHCYEPYGRPVYDNWGGGSCSCRSRGYYVCRCEYVCENNPSSCTIM